MDYVDCGTLITAAGEAPITDGRLRIEDGRVVEAGPIEDVPEGDTRIDHSTETVLPGLIDAHLHLAGGRSMDPLSWTIEDDALAAARATADARSLLEAGFTTIRDMGSPHAIGVRDAIDEGTVPGPRIFASGLAISQTGGHGDTHSLPLEWIEGGGSVSALADGVAECRKEARKRIRDDADCLKIMTTGGVLSEFDEPAQRQFTDEEIAAMTEEAHRVGMPVASHAQGTEGIVAALENGVDTIEHAFYLDDAAIDLLLEADATLVPTMAIMDRIIERGGEAGVPDHGIRKAEAAFEAHTESIRQAYQADVPIATGTDFIGPELIPHGENALELELLVDRVGMDELEAIHSATRVAARTVPADDVGTLAEGAHADFVVADDPLSDITALYEPTAVYKGGRRA